MSMTAVAVGSTLGALGLRGTQAAVSGARSMLSSGARGATPAAASIPDRLPTSAGTSSAGRGKLSTGGYVIKPIAVSAAIAAGGIGAMLAVRAVVGADAEDPVHGPERGAAQATWGGVLLAAGLATAAAGRGRGVVLGTAAASVIAGVGSITEGRAAVAAGETPRR